MVMQRLFFTGRAPKLEHAHHAMTALPDELTRYLDHLRVERRLSARSIALYTQALLRLTALAEAEGTDLRALSPAQLRRGLARLHAQGLGPRSLAIALAAWRGLYRDRK